MSQDYLTKIRAVESPEEAATLIRAQACHNAVSLTCYDNAQRISIIEQAERLAETVERPFDEDSGVKPWIQWLREAGY
jgi:hypothetical protein